MVGRKRGASTSRWRPLLGLAVVAALFGALALFIQMANRRAAEHPPLPAFVIDEAGVLSASARRAMEDDLRALDAEGGAQIVVLVVPGLNGAPIENVAIDRARRWRIGREGRNNGVLLLLAWGERRARVEVGYGLEAVLTDARARMIVENDILPPLREGDVATAARSGLDAIVKIAHPAPLRKAERDAPQKMGVGWLAGVALFLLVAAIVILGVVQALLLANASIRGRVAASRRWAWFARIRILGGESGGAASRESGSSDGPRGGGGSFGGGGANG